jgi:hypothetical protein
MQFLLFGYRIGVNNTDFLSKGQLMLTLSNGKNFINILLALFFILKHKYNTIIY